MEEELSTDLVTKLPSECTAEEPQLSSLIPDQGKRSLTQRVGLADF